MLRKFLGSTIIISFFLTNLGPIPQAHADTVLGLPQPGTMINLSPAYMPVLMKGLKIHPENPVLFDFILDTGDSGLKADSLELRNEANKLIKYFLASLTIPDKNLWVNLSPYEKDRIIPQQLGDTVMGRDMLAQDYILKQMTASLIYPENNLGREFWNKVYAHAQDLYGTDDVPVNTFNKVWIVADKAKVYVNDNTAYVVGSHLKVMLEEDYLALQKHAAVPTGKAHSVASNVIREIILPELEKEINTGKNFSNLRQMFYAMILASWYKKNLKECLLNQVYSDKSKINGINLQDVTIKEKIYQQYLIAYKKGVFNYIKEDLQGNGQMIPRKYFSGGLQLEDIPEREVSPQDPDAAMTIQHPVDGVLILIETRASPAMTVVESLAENVKKAFQATTLRDFIDSIHNDYFVNTQERLRNLSQYLEKTDPYFTSKIMEPENLTSEWSEDWLYNSKGKKYDVDILSTRSANSSAGGVPKGGLRALLSYKPDENEMRQANDLMRDPAFVKAFNYLNGLLKVSSEDPEKKKAYVKEFLQKWIDEEAKALSMWMSFKTSLLGLPLGGGKGIFFVGQIRENEDKTFSIEDPEVWVHKKNKNKPSPEDEASFEFQESEFRGDQAKNLIAKIRRLYPVINMAGDEDPIIGLNDLLKSYSVRLFIDSKNPPKTVEETRLRLEKLIPSIPKKQDRDNRNIARISRLYVRMLDRQGRLGPDTDVPAPDKGTDGVSMGFATDEYIRLHLESDIKKRDTILYDRLQQKMLETMRDNDGIYPDTSTVLVEEASKYLHEKKSKLVGVPELAVFTGKKLEHGGVEGRTEATGYGVESMIESVLEATKYRDDLDPDYKISLAIQGAGNVALYLALKATINGKIVKVLGDEGVTLIKEKGFTKNEILEFIRRFESRQGKMYEIWKDVVENVDDVTAIVGVGDDKEREKQRLDAILEAKVDVLCPCALEGVITDENADDIKAKFVVAGANGPITAAGLRKLLAKKKIVVPDTLANAGGVMVSYFEQVQAKTGYIFKKEEVEEIGQQIHKTAFAQVWTESRRREISLTEAADIVAAQGIIRAQYLSLVKKFNGDLKQIIAERNNGETEAQLEKQIKSSGLSAHLKAIQGESLEILVESGDKQQLIRQANDAKIIIAANTVGLGATPIFTPEMMSQISPGKILVGPVAEADNINLNSDDLSSPIKMDDGNLSINYLHPTSQFRFVASQRLSQVTQLLTEELSSGNFTGNDVSGVHSGIVSYNGHTITPNNPINESDLEKILKSTDGKKRTIGIPAEIFKGETRVGATPAEVEQLVKKGYTVLVEYGAGSKSNISNELYRRVGARLVSQQGVWQADVIRKVRAPLPEEYGYLTEGKILESFLYLKHPDTEELRQVLASKKITAVAYEEVKKPGHRPLIDRVYFMNGVDAESDTRENYVRDPMARVAGSVDALLGALYFRHDGNYSEYTDSRGKITESVIAEKKIHLQKIIEYIQAHLQAFKNHTFAFPDFLLRDAGINKDGIDGSVLVLGMDNNLSARAAALDLLLLKAKKVTIIVKSEKDKELLEEQFRKDGLLRQKRAEANFAQAASRNPGGINLDSDNMQLDVNVGGFNVRVDQAMVNYFKDPNFTGVSPDIIRIKTITNPWLGLEGF